MNDMKRRGIVGLIILGVFACLNCPGLLRFSSVNAAPSGRRSPEGAATPSPNGNLVYYVSVRGNDTWSGKLKDPNARRTDGPFRTLLKARDAIRLLKASGLLTKPVTVYVRGGVYQLKSPLIFTPEDSGTSRFPIVYSAYPGEIPELSGGEVIRGWKRYIGAKFPSSARGHLWVARVPGVKHGNWYFHQFFVNGERRTRARAPNRGFFYVDGAISKGTHAQFKFHDDDIHPEWAHEDDVEVIDLQAWADIRMPIRTVDESTHTLVLAGQFRGRENNSRYWVENTPEALDAPGEWYLDRKNGLVYYYPMPGEDMSRVRAVAPRLRQIILFEGNAQKGKFVSYIRLKGFTLAYTDWQLPATGYVDRQAAYDIPAAVYGSGAHFCSLERCLLTHLGGYAIEFSHGSKGDRISHNNMADLGAGGVKIGDPMIPADSNDQTTGILSADNHIHNTGKVFPGAVGVWVGQSSGNRIAHNEINDTTYTGISVGWTWGDGPSSANNNVIEFNDLHDIGQGMLSDLGCIYTLGVQPGTVVRNNLCHDVSSYRYGGWGIYLDEGSSDILVEDNVVYKTETGGFHLHYGNGNIIRNNIFALGEETQIKRGPGHQGQINGLTFERNIVYWKNGVLSEGGWDGIHVRFDHNLYYSVFGGGSPKGLPIMQFSKWSFGEWQKKGHDTHSIIADPLFFDPDAGDFSLDVASPAFKLGFKPIDLSHVGPRPIPYHKAPNE